MEETKELITTDDIRSKVYIIRGQQVMLDKDLAEIYGYEVKKLNQQVKRNIERFPEDFMFRLSNSEIDSVRSQIVTSRKKDFFAGQEGGRRYLPYAFTEQGIYMLATVLRGESAEQQSIFIMRTFREMRHYIRQNQQFVTRNEMDLLTAKVGTITERQDRMENKVDSIQKDVTTLADNFITDKDKKNFVIYKGQKLEADIAYIEIYQQAKKSIYVVDDYMNAKSLQHLSQKAEGVEVVLFTENGKGGKAGLDKYDANKAGNDHVAYTYRVLESATETGQFYGGAEGDVIEINGKKYKVHNTTVTGNSADKTLTLTNQLQNTKYKLVITKQDAQEPNTKLGGVEFKLEKPDAELSETKTGKTAEETGELTFADLTPGSYRLTETKTAEGYTLLAEPIEFTLTADGRCLRGDETFVETTAGADGVYNIALTVYNRKGFTLPHTGSDAPSLWLLIGLPALVAVLLVLVFRYNKKGGKHS